MNSNHRVLYRISIYCSMTYYTNRNMKEDIAIVLTQHNIFKSKGYVVQYLKFWNDDSKRTKCILNVYI